VTRDTDVVAEELRQVREIEALVRRYADVCDEAYDPDKLVQLFTADAVWEASSEQGTSDFGVHSGRQEIYDFFAGVSREIVHAHHIVMSPEIELTEPGVAATGRWNTIVLMQLANDEHATDAGQAKLMAGVYTHQYRCEEGVWRMSHLHVHTRFDLRLSHIG
jgi:hypothetical protein